MPVLGKLTEGLYGFSARWPNKLLKSIGVVYRVSAFAAYVFAEKVCDRGSPGVESSQNEDCGFDGRGAGGRLKPMKAWYTAGLAS